MAKRMRQNLENYPMKTLENGKKRNVVRGLVGRPKEMFWKDGEVAARRVAKQNRFNSSLIKSDNALGYKLLHPDKSEVLRDFTWQKDLECTLRKCKEELGKPYSRISFYL